MGLEKVDPGMVPLNKQTSRTMWWLTILSKRVHMKCLVLPWRPQSCQFSHKNHLFYPFVIKSLYLSLLCLSAALL